MDWQDALADEVRQLEANGVDIASGDKARALLRVLRGYEARVHQLALRIATSMPTPSPPARHHVGRRGPDKKLFRTNLVDQGVYTDDPE